MKKLKMSELMQSSIDELGEKLQGLKKTLMEYRFQAKTGKLERQSATRETRRDIARILTAIEKQKGDAGKTEVKS